MKPTMAVVVTLLLASMLIGPGPVAAQHSPPGGPPTPADAPGGGMHGKPGGGTPPGAMGGAMMCPMMMSMMGRQADPRAMQMHGEMMKAMGDIMMKYGKMAEGGGTR